jgi:hypothetical protein
MKDQQKDYQSKEKAKASQKATNPEGRCNSGGRVDQIAEELFAQIYTEQENYLLEIG